MASLEGTSADATVAAVTGTQSSSGPGVLGSSDSGPGVSGHSAGGPGVSAESDKGTALHASGHGTVPTFEAVNDNPTDQAGPGMRAISRAAGVIGESSTWIGVLGVTTSVNGGSAVLGQGVGPAAGVAGTSTEGIGVLGQTSSTQSPGVRGEVLPADGNGAGVLGIARSSGNGVEGHAERGAALAGFSGNPPQGEGGVNTLDVGVFGESAVGAGVVGYAHNKDAPAVWAYGGLRAHAVGHPYAGEFTGDLMVHGDIFLPGADCAEQFDLEDDAEAGDVLVISKTGGLRRSRNAYDPAVAGVLSGAGSLRPAIVLDSEAGTRTRRPVALVGKVYCKIDADYGAVKFGDLLTSSDTPGHAMVASDRAQAFGSVLGKALGGLSFGTGLLPILVCLQ